MLRTLNRTQLTIPQQLIALYNNTAKFQSNYNVSYRLRNNNHKCKIHTASSNNLNTKLANDFQVPQPQINNINITVPNASSVNKDGYATIPPIPQAPLFPGLNQTKRVCISLSGGVDSSVSAYLLKAAGYNLTSIHMINWDELNETGTCTGEKDVKDTKLVCNHAKISIPYNEVNFVREYWNLVFQDLLNGYESGITPNPDNNCNREIKFNLLLKHCFEKLNVDFVATGHYARTQVHNTLINELYGPNNSFNNLNENNINIDSKTYIDKAMQDIEAQVKRATDGSHNNNSGKYPTKLLTAIDSTKDQSYFLSTTRTGSLDRVIFPIGNLVKPSVRAIASELNLITATKPDSMGICFVGPRKFPKFLSEYLNLRPGNFVTLDNKIMAQHNGVQLYTIGQSARIAGLKQKYYIAKKNLVTNEIIIVNDRLHPLLLYDKLYVNKMNWISGNIPQQLIGLQNELICEAKCRSTEIKRRVKIKIVKKINNTNNHSNSDFDNRYEYEIEFLDEPHSIISPGQIIAFYQNSIECLGGGIIDRTGPSYYEIGKQFNATLAQ